MLKDLAFSFSLANLIFLEMWSQLFSTGYFQKNPGEPFHYLAILLNVLLWTAFFFAATSLVRRWNRTAFTAAGSLLLLFLLFIPLNHLRSRLNWHYAQISALLKNPLAWILIVMVLGVLIKWRRPVIRGLVIGLAVLFPLALFNCGRAFWCAVNSEPPITPKSPSLATQTGTNSPRIVWILFDELDQRVAFSERPAGLLLPELDRFAGTSWHAENATSPAGVTLLSMPSLITGQIVVKAQPDGPSELMLTLTNSAGPIGWSTLPNIFRDTREMKLNTAVIGWYHPYARVLGGDLTVCSWMSFPPYDTCGGSNLWSAMQSQVLSLSPLRWRQLHLQISKHTFEEAKKIAAEKQFSLILCHLPIPHYPGIYDRFDQKFKLSSFDVAESYLNNLALVDRIFGELRHAMETAGAWETSTIIVTSDHWWREANNLDGKMDHRVPLLIKFPGRHESATYSKPLNTVVLHDLMLAVLRREIETPTDLTTWLEQGR